MITQMTKSAKSPFALFVCLAMVDSQGHANVYFLLCCMAERDMPYSILWARYQCQASTTACRKGV
jgi:hypothetical protein